MALTKLTGNMNNHQSLPDKPALDAEDLKILYDKAPNDIKDYINNTLSVEIDVLIATLDAGKIAKNQIVNNATTGGADNVASAEIVKLLQQQINGKANSSHTHDDRYYTESEINTKLNGKANSSHTHDDRYYTESEVNTKLNGKANSSHTHTTGNITGLKSGATTTISKGTGTPSGGSDGDVYIQYF